MRANDMGGAPRSPPRLALGLHLALFAATLATTLWAGYGLAPGGDGSLLDVAARGLPFAGSLLAILLAHEMGHWVVARRHGVDASLPFFLPAPFGVGTFGAMIKLRSPVPSRRAALEIGAAGPLAGLAVALPLLLVGYALSEVREVAVGTSATGAASPWALVASLLSGEAPAAGAGGTFLGDSAITWAARWLVHGGLGPGADVVLHPIGFAAWIGLLVTALNLVPAGQLDGGHVLYALLGQRRAFLASRVVAAALLAAGLLLSWNWLVWWLLTRAVIGLAHPRAEIEAPLGRRSRALAYATLAVFVLTFVPVPVSF